MPLCDIGKSYISPTQICKTWYNSTSQFSNSYNDAYATECVTEF